MIRTKVSYKIPRKHQQIIINLHVAIKIIHFIPPISHFIYYVAIATLYNYCNKSLLKRHLIHNDIKMISK